MPKITPGLRDCTNFWVGITGSKNPIGDRLWNVPLMPFRMATNGGIAKCRVTGQHDRRVKFLASQVAILAEHYFEPCNG